jgi:hypothetical protein
LLIHLIFALTVVPFNTATSGHERGQVHFSEEDEFRDRGVDSKNGPVPFLRRPFQHRNIGRRPVLSEGGRRKVEKRHSPPPLSAFRLPLSNDRGVCNVAAIR